MAPAPEDSGMGSEVELSMTNSLVIVSFLTIAWYNVLELTILVQAFFKRHSGWYYYSLLVATWGIFFHGLGMFFKFYKITNIDILDTVTVYTGWIMMVTGQSIVLYSRLHLVVHASWKRWVLVMIIVNALVLHTITGVLTFLTNLSSDPKRWKGPYSIVERVQVLIFFIQEVILSSIYIWKTSAMLRAAGPIFNAKENARGDRGRRVLLHTIGINIVIIALEITLVALEFSGLYDIQTSYKGAVYSIKLKMEFTILNQLMNLVKGNLHDTSLSRSYPLSGTRATNRSIIRTTKDKDKNPRLSVGPYSKMEDGTHTTVLSPGTDIKLRNLNTTSNNDEILKTTTTEVRFDRADDFEMRGKGLRKSSSSEVYIIERDEDKA